MKSEHAAAREFGVTTRFQIEALKPGGLSRDEALKQAEQNLAVLRIGFPATLAAQIDDLRQAADPARADDPESYGRLKLKCTDLSDAATTIGYALVGYVALSLREACDSAAFPARRDAIVACHVDALRLCGTETFRTLSVSDVPDLIDGLRRIVKSD